MTSHAVIVNLLFGPMHVLAVTATTPIVRPVLRTARREALGRMRIAPRVESLPLVIATSEGVTSAPPAASQPVANPLRAAEILSVTRM